MMPVGRTVGALGKARIAIGLALASASIGHAAQPNSAEDLTDRGLALAQAGDERAAANLWHQALAIKSDYFPALFNLGYMEFASGRLKDAAPYLERACEADPTDFNAHYLRGTVAEKLGDGVEALRAWRLALALQPDHYQLMQIMAVEYGKGRYHSEAAHLANRALRLRPELEDLYFMAIHAHRESGDLSQGLRIAAEAVKRFPASARANFELAWHLQRQGRFSEALPLLEKAIALDPNYEEPHFFYGDWLVKQARFEEALEPLQRAVRIRPNYMPARIAMARALMGLKRWQESLDVLNEAVAVEPRHPQPHLMLSQVHFRLRNREEARKAKEVSLRLRRENPSFLEAVQSRPFPE